MKKNVPAHNQTIQTDQFKNACQQGKFFKTPQNLDINFNNSKIQQSIVTSRYTF